MSSEQACDFCKALEECSDLSWLYFLNPRRFQRYSEFLFKAAFPQITNRPIKYVKAPLWQVCWVSRFLQLQNALVFVVSRPRKLLFLFFPDI